MPVRTKISSTSFTRARSSLMAAATVFMSLTLGAESASRACSTWVVARHNSGKVEGGADIADAQAGGEERAT